MKSVFLKLFQNKFFLEDAWAATRIDQPDTLVLRQGDDDLCETVPMELLASATHS
jgi:hypothetical protein